MNTIKQFIIDSWNYSSATKLNEEHQELISIVKKMCYHPDTVFLMAPESSRYYLKNEKFGYFIVLTYDNIKLINHKFHKEVPLHLKSATELIKIVKHRIEVSRLEMEKEITGSSLELLKKISNSLEV